MWNVRRIPDPVLVVVNVVPGLADLLFAGAGWHPVAVASVLGPAGALAIRRRYPVLAFWLVLAATVATQLLSVLLLVATTVWAVLPCITAAFFLAAHVPARRALRIGLGGLLLAVAVAGGNALLAPEGYRGSGLLALWAVALVISWSTGAQTRAAAVELALARERLEQGRLAAVRAERGRIARELHDVASHHLTQLVVRAEVLRAQSSALPDWATTEITALADDGRRAGTELRAMLGLLRAGDSGATPGLADLDDLVARVPDATLDRTQLPTVDPVTGLTAYRLVQEGITNAQKHSRGSSILIRLSAVDEKLTVSVVNSPPAEPGVPVPSQGVGLIGLRERVETIGGTFTAGPTTAGGFQILAHLPIEGQRL